MFLPNNFVFMTLGYLIDEENQSIYFGRKKYGEGKGVIVGFGGKVEKNDKTIDEAMKRELKEEAGIDVTRYTRRGLIIFTSLAKDKKLGLAYVYVIDTWLGNIIETEEMKPEKFYLNRIPFDQMWETDRFWLNFIFTKQDAIIVCRRDEENKNKKIEINLLDKLPEIDEKNINDFVKQYL